MLFPFLHLRVTCFKCPHGSASCRFTKFEVSSASSNPGEAMRFCHHLPIATEFGHSSSEATPKALHSCRPLERPLSLAVMARQKSCYLPTLPWRTTLRFSVSKLPLYSRVAASCAIALSQVAWDSSNVGSVATLSDLVMPSNTCGYVVGDNDTIAKSANGGLNLIQQTSGTTLSLVTAAFTDTLHGCAAGSNVLRYTTNGGTSWLTPA